MSGLRHKEWLPYGTLCFVGDSITQTGLYARSLLEFAVSRYPERCRFFVNCGSAGETAEMVLTRMGRDILVHAPDAACIMLGMNDVGRYMYPMGALSEELLSSRKRRLEEYSINMDKIISILRKKGIIPILITPSPFDQQADLPAANNPGCNDALGQCAAIVENLAVSYNAALIDLWAPMNEINDSVRMQDSSATLIGQDRVHPDARGHMVMTYLFLKQSGAANRLPRIRLHGSQLDVIEASECGIENVSGDADGTIRLSYTSNRIPLYLDAAYRSADQLVPLTQDFNQEEIRISGLPAKDYECWIDEQRIGVYSSMEMSDGVNIAVIDNTSGQMKAAELHRLAVLRYGLESRLRSIRYIEQGMYRNGIDFQKQAEAAQYVRHSLSMLAPDQTWMRGQYTTYLEYRPRETDIFVQIRETTERMYRFVCPFKRSLIFRPCEG